MERSFKEEVKLLALGAGDTFHGEGILAVTKALLQSGVSLRRRLPGRAGLAPDRRAERRARHPRRARRPLRDQRVARPARRRCSAPRSTTRCAARSPGSRRSAPTSPPTRCPTSPRPASRGGALIVIGEDYGEGAIDHPGAHARLRDEVADLAARPAAGPADDRRAWSRRASSSRRPRSTPVMLELRIRACHVHGSFATQGQPRRRRSRSATSLERPSFDYGRICLPPSTYAQEKHKIEVRWPAAVTLHPRAAPERGLRRPRTTTSASSARAACTTPSSARCSSSGSPTRSATAQRPDLLS